MSRARPSLITAAASGAWATPERLRGYGVLLVVAYLLCGIALVASGTGYVDLSGRPIGADFGMMWSAGQTALSGHPTDVFDLPAQANLQNKVFGDAAGFTPWHYPPTFLLIAAPLAALPYLAALAVWQALTLALYLVAARACAGAKTDLRRWALLAAAAFPAAFINAAHGQNGFLTTALATGAVLLVGSRPLAAGVLLALLSYKPQFCVLIPVVMLASGAWRALAAAAIASVALVGLTLVIFGADVAPAFLASLPDAKRLTLETGATGWEKIQSVFAALRLNGASFDAAMLAQTLVALLVIATTVFVWRSSAHLRLKQALVFPGILLTTPYCVDYDMVLLAPALVLLGAHGVERGFARWEISLLAFVFVTPVLARLVAGATHVPLGVVAIAALFIWTLRRARADARVATGAGVRTSPAPPLPSAS